MLSGCLWQVFRLREVVGQVLGGGEGAVLVGAEGRGYHAAELTCPPIV